MAFARRENSKFAEAWNKRDAMGLMKQIRVIARERVVYRLLIYRRARRCANMAATI